MRLRYMFLPAACLAGALLTGMFTRPSDAERYLEEMTENPQIKGACDITDDRKATLYNYVSARNNRPELRKAFEQTNKNGTASPVYSYDHARNLKSNYIILINTDIGPNFNDCLLLDLTLSHPYKNAYIYKRGSDRFKNAFGPADPLPRLPSLPDIKTSDLTPE